ncbi:hypothetical protein ASG01_01480 [Chryseobacterium sp. Leaf180]|uniref:hypothetical protein n=1 Tax=Chryseobacterium sp. Leaf180 TaxID=1736289 RepID=UPI0006F2F916|nr:hypothetical protein [Chryseobacterium sp. Leaf180]KQR94582.1 hypothetical protein ASG01_01480 [Chryseobacterium sp. Leaf180]
MKHRIQILSASLFLFAAAAFFGNVNAQTSQSNVIPEVQLNKKDAFTEIRNLLIDNFDFTNSDYTPGIINSEVKFDISEKGKIVNVRSKGDCKVVSKEIENVLSHLQYRLDKEKLSSNLLASSYVMPVTVAITDR